MRALTADEIELRDRRRVALERVIAERMPVLHEFAELLELNEPAMIVAQPDRYLPAVDQYMQKQVIEPQDRAWILARLAYLIGEVLVERMGGCWMLNENPDSRTFLRIVVGQFGRAAKPGAMVDPFEVADSFLSQPMPRNLSRLVSEIELTLRSVP